MNLFVKYSRGIHFCVVFKYLLVYVRPKLIQVGNVARPCLGVAEKCDECRTDCIKPKEPWNSWVIWLCLCCSQGLFERQQKAGDSELRSAQIFKERGGMSGEDRLWFEVVLKHEGKLPPFFPLETLTAQSHMRTQPFQILLPNTEKIKTKLSESREEATLIHPLLKALMPVWVNSRWPPTLPNTKRAVIKSI